MSNPLGVQQDGLFSEGGEPDFSVDIVMESKGMLTADGYSIEAAIPFSSLRYEVGKGKLWGVHALRYIRHLDEEDSWMPLRRDKAGLDKASGKETRARFLAQAEHITGLEEIATERTLEIIPVLTIAETGRRVRALPHAASLLDPGRFVNQPVNVDAGLTGRVLLTPGVTVDRSWKFVDYDFGAGPKFPRVSPAALANPDAPLDPGPGNTTDITASFAWQPTEALRASIDYTKSRLVRIDTRRTAYDQNLWSLRASYYFTRFTFARARVDYDTLAARGRGQFLLGWTPHPGTSLYAGYNDDLNYNGYGPFTNQFERGWQRNSRTFFIKLSYLFRREL